jgi:hypothetical protein
VLWDAGYGTELPDLPFLPSAMLLTRVVSRPGSQRVCLDLGHKAVASENPHPRVVLIDPSPAPGRSLSGAIGESARALGLPLLDAPRRLSEEHQMLESPQLHLSATCSTAAVASARPFRTPKR